MLEVKECVNSYVKYQISEKKSVERTINKYVTCINEMIDIMRIETIEDIDNLNWPDMREQWLRVKEVEGLSASSLNLRISSVRSFLGYLEGKKLIKENIAIRLDKFKTKPREVEVDINKIKYMLKLVNEDFNKNPCFLTARDRYIVHMLLFTGIRNEEIRNLTIYDMNVNGKFSVTGKFNKKRISSIPDKMINMHQEYSLWYRNNVPCNSDYLFVSKNGNRLDKNVPNRIIKDVSKRAGISNWTCHSTRHATITLLLDSDVSIEEVATIAGHTSVNTTLKNYYNPHSDCIKQNINKNKLLSDVM